MDVIFCDSCNPDHITEWDRRAESNQGAPSQELRYMSRRSQRQGPDRRVEVRVELGFSERRDSRGRRRADGSAWFEGPAEAAVRNGWLLTGSGGNIFCPGCRRRRSAP